MNKLYADLHIVTGDSRKPFLNLCLLFFLALPISNNTVAQCTNSNAAGNVNAPAAGNSVQINSCVSAGDYSTINGVAASTSYTVNSTTSSDFFTIRQGTPGGTVIASGTSPLTWTSTVSGTYYVHLNTNAACGTQATCRLVVIKNNSCITPPAPLVVPSFANMCIGDPPVKLQVVSSAPATSQFCAGNLNIPVPDNNPAGVSKSVNVAGIPAACSITGISVTVNMPHTRIGDMVFVLKAPNGQIINLDYYLSNTGGGGPTSGFTNTIISSVGTVALSSGVNPYTATFKADLQGGASAGPAGMTPTSTNWANLFSIVNGVWTLGMYDGVASNTGTLSSWCLNITYSCTPNPPVPVRPAIWSPAAGLYLDAAATTPYVGGTAVDVVWARPIPAGVYTYQVTVQSYNALSIEFTNPAAITIPVGGPAAPYPSNLTVAGLPMAGISVKSVTLHGISHTASEDIDIVLQSPSGQNVMLMSDVGATTALSGNTFTFDDFGPAMSITGANASGIYRPTNNGVPDIFPTPGPSMTQAAPALSLFTGSMNGNWKLFVQDDDGTANQGTIAGGFTITFDVYLPGCATSAPTNVVVTVNQSVVITQQPINQTICTDKIATFAVTATGTGLTYQWQESSNGGGTYNNIVNGGVYNGVNTNTLTITAPPVSMNGYLYRVVLNGGGTCAGNTSQPATLTVNPKPVVTITANPVLLLPGMTTTIYSTVTPNPAATYTWLYNGIVIPGATADTFVVDINGLGAYQLSVTDINGCGDVSNIITIAHAFALNLFVYPNPTSGKFQVRSHSDANSIVQRSLLVYNNRGDRLITRRYSQTSPYQQIGVDIRAYGKGIYWVEVRDENGKRLGINRVAIQ